MTKLKPISLLIIDDNEQFLETISAFLAEHYAKEVQILSTAKSAQEGIDLAKKLRPQVVLLDLKMPEMHGFDVIPLLRLELPELKIITTTLLAPEVLTQAEEIYVKANIAAGSDGFIPKHLLTKDLVPTMQKMIVEMHEMINHNQEA